MFVTNNNEFDYSDRFNGNDFAFPAGGTVQVDFDAARHFFGLGDADKMPYLVRSGWAQSSNGFDVGMKILNNFVFSDSPLGIEDVIQASEATSEETESSPAIPLAVAGSPASIEVPASSEAPIQEPEAPAPSSNLLDKLGALS